MLFSQTCRHFVSLNPLPHTSVSLTSCISIVFSVLNILPHIFFFFFYYLFNFTMDIQCSSSCFREVMIMRYIEMNMMSYKCKHKQ